MGASRTVSHGRDRHGEPPPPEDFVAAKLHCREAQPLLHVFLHPAPRAHRRRIADLRWNLAWRGGDICHASR